MIPYYLDLIISILMGQLFAASVWTYIFQFNNENIKYWKALKLYLKKERGSIALIISFTIIIMFIIPDWFDLHKSKADLLSMESLTKFEFIQSKWRTFVILYGIFLQSLALLVYKGGRELIKNYGKEKAGINPEEELKP